MTEKANTRKCIGCGKVPRRSYDLGVFLGDGAEKGRYCMACLAEIYRQAAKQGGKDEKQG